MKSVQDYIRTYDLDLPRDLLDRILSKNPEFSESKHSFCRECSFSQISTNESLKDEDGLICSQLQNALKSYAQEFNISKQNFEDTGYELLRFSKNGRLEEHAEAGSKLLAIYVVLEQPKNGERFSFFGKKKCIELCKHRAIVFPSNFMYPHRIDTVEEGSMTFLYTRVS